MKRFALLLFLGLLSLVLIACDSTTLESSSTTVSLTTETTTLNSTTVDITTVIEETTTTYLTTAIETTTIAQTTEYVKDGDIMNYLRTMGEQGIYGDGTDYNDETTYRLELTFSDGMTVTIAFVDLYDSEIKIFDIVAAKGTESMTIQCYWNFQYDTSVTYTNTDQYLDGWLAFNGFDQSPVMSLADYEYDVTGTNTESAMQTMLNQLITNLVSYYETNIME